MLVAALVLAGFLGNRLAATEQARADAAVQLRGERVNVRVGEPSGGARGPARHGATHVIGGSQSGTELTADAVE